MFEKINKKYKVVDKIKIPTVITKEIELFPNITKTLEIRDKDNINTIKIALKKDKKVFLKYEIPDDFWNGLTEYLFSVNVICEIKDVDIVNKDLIFVTLQGCCLGKFQDTCENVRYLLSEVDIIEIDMETDKTEQEIEATTRALRAMFESYCNMLPNVPSYVIDDFKNAKTPYENFNVIAHYSINKLGDRNDLLSEDKFFIAYDNLLNILKKEIEILSIEKDIFRKVKRKMGKKEREYMLRQQIDAMINELGEQENNLVENSPEVQEISNKLESIFNISKQAREKLMKECEKLSKLQPNSQEYSHLKNYVDTCLELPWDSYTKDRINLLKAKKILDKNHYGLEKVKERILEFLAVRQLSKTQMSSQIICLVGPPGVGKTSIAKVIAETIGRRFVRVSLGGIRDEAEIRGHRKTYLGAMAGRIATGLIQSKSFNPVMLLDEIDKMSMDYKGDPSSALLEVLDSEQNDKFRDHYLEIPIDLSDVLFITTANSYSDIPTPLLDRMEIIQISSYTREEKFNIAKKHLIPKQIENNGVKGKISISESVIYCIIDNYTKEAGVRNLEKVISKLCRKVAFQIIDEEKKKVAISEKNIENFLGTFKFKSQDIKKDHQIGTVTGLAWTSVGGETLPVEVSILDGTGKLELTGKLGDVMKESAKLAVSYARSVTEQYNIEKNFYKTKDIHIHAPEGAVPKDGPSAGITMTTALISALSNVKVRGDVAMTGEITLRGKVLPIGGLKEKSMAAYKSGIKTVIIPKENLCDLDEVDEVVKQNLNFVGVDNIGQVLSNALIK